MIQDSILISVVVPVYNGEKYISQTISSVLSQTYKNWELLIVDDCSEDSTLKIVEEYQKENDRIVVLRTKKNSGVAIARNIGIKQARGEYIALLDADDIWRETKLEKQLELALKECADIVYCSYGLIDSEGKNLNRDFIVPPYTSFELMLVSSAISCSTAMISTNILKKNLFKNEYYHEDLMLWLELLSIPVKAAGVVDVLADYRQIEGSRSHKKLHSALERWRVYRKGFNLPIGKSVYCFLRYAFKGLQKYY